MPDSDSVPVVLVRYFAGARAAAGCAEEKVRASTVDELLRRLSDAHGDRLARVLEASSLLVNGVAAKDRTGRLPIDATVDVLPPFAGG